MTKLVETNYRQSLPNTHLKTRAFGGVTKITHSPRFKYPASATDIIRVHDISYYSVCTVPHYRNAVPHYSLPLITQPRQHTSKKDFISLCPKAPATCGSSCYINIKLSNNSMQTNLPVDSDFFDVFLMKKLHNKL